MLTGVEGAEPSLAANPSQCAINTTATGNPVTVPHSHVINGPNVAGASDTVDPAEGEISMAPISAVLDTTGTTATINLPTSGITAMINLPTSIASDAINPLIPDMTGASSGDGQTASGKTVRAAKSVTTTPRSNITPLTHNAQSIEVK